MVDQEWLTINYALPKEPSRIRVSVWRRLKKSGAVILGQSVWFLPATKDNEEFMQKVSNEIRQNGGNSYIMRMVPQDESTSQRILDAFNAARDEEYGELLEQCENLIIELEKETSRKKFTFAELEENEDELQKLVDWHQKIVNRDFHEAPLRPSAAEKIEQCKARFADFSTEVYRHSSGEPSVESKTL